VRAALEQWQRAAADEVDLEAEEIVLIARRLGDGGRRRVDVEQPRDETADVRRHADEQVRQRQRRPRRIGRPAVRVPVAPEQRIGGCDLLAEPFVQRRETFGIVQIGKRVSGDTQSWRRNIHRVLRRYNTSARDANSAG